MSTRRKKKGNKSNPPATTPARRVSQLEQMDLASKAPTKPKRSALVAQSSIEESQLPSSPSPASTAIPPSMGRVTRSSTSATSPSSSATAPNATANSNASTLTTQKTPKPSGSKVEGASPQDLAIAKLRKMLGPLKKGPTIFEGATPDDCGDEAMEDTNSGEAAEILKDLLSTAGIDLDAMASTSDNRNRDVAMPVEDAQTDTESEGSESEDEPPVTTRKGKALNFREKIMSKVTRNAAEEDEKKRKGEFEPPMVDKRLKINKIHETTIEKRGGLPSNWRNNATNKKPTNLQSPDNQPAKSAAIMAVPGSLVDDMDNEASVGAEGPLKANSSMVKLEFNKPAKAVDAPNKAKAKSTSKKPTNESLGLTAAQLHVWKTALCSTWYAYLASLNTIWDVGTDEDTLANIEYLYNKLIAPLTGKNIDDLNTSSVVYRLLAQRGYEHRSAVADWALANGIAHFFNVGEEDNPEKYKNVEERILYIEEAINGATFSFIYEKPEIKGKIFRTPHVLATFGFVLSTHKNSRFEFEQYPGGLTLSVLAVHRAHELWGENNGIQPASVRGHGSFSHSAHGNRANQYLALVAQLNKRQWRDIIKRSREAYCLATGQPVPASLKTAGHVEKPSKEDERFMALEVRESSDIEPEEVDG
ncbi:hypothetical protein CC1G_13225 [Coprinopsis cinerea okayama7|uniref:Uncharacterized protein n=1 Tax=Coprinopsis cinerea (strain Okayama-7 / 130 / ATCC MYA-4618 / FGSC 9003) TaxID=240176 RepID=A8N826_COPC7|nr:hypothetical protein CC1G_13225 [Coprinopsis cinerea okayama7\|eukprot:XP_001830982.2 hypothetical protein CC1G_13225 [Coprinopsis cinerea okayama7\